MIEGGTAAAVPPSFFTQLGSKLDTGRWAYNSREVTNRLKDTAKSSVFSFGLLNLPADVVSMQQQLADMQFQKRVDELAAVYEKNVPQSEQIRSGQWNISESETPLTVKTDDVYIGHSVGAKSRNYEVVDKITGEIYSFTEGSKIQDSEVFAGSGVRTPLRSEVSEGLAKEFGGKPGDWQHAKGYAELTQDGEEVRLAEVHWFQAKSIGKVKFKIKRWLDE